MEKLKWLFELVDRMSGPAANMVKKLGGVSDALKKSDALTKSFSSSLNGTGRDAMGRFVKSGNGLGGMLNRVFGSKLSSKFEGLGASIKQAFAPARRDEMGRFLKQGRGLQAFESIGSGISSFGGAIASVGAATAAAAGGLAVVGGKWALGALSFKENTMAAFKAMLGSEKEAAKTFAAAQKFAAETPFTTDQVVGSFQKLITGGFRGEGLNTMMKAAGDVGALMGTDAMASVIKAVSQIKSTGKLQGDELMQLADAGVSLDAVYKALGASLGKSTDEVIKLKEAGKITADQGIAAVTEAIRTTLSGGELGGAMAAQSRTLSGLFSTLASVPFDLMMAVDGTALEPLKTFIATLTGALSPTSEAGKRIIAIFDKVGSAFASLFQGANGGRDIDVTLRGILNVAEPLIDAFLAFGKGASQGLGAVFKMLLDVAIMLGDQPGFVENLVKTFTMLGQVAGFVLGAIVVGFAAIGAAQVWVLDQIRQLIDWFSSLGADIEKNWRTIGVSIIQALIDGITSMLNPLAAIAGAIAETLITGTGADPTGMGTSPATRAAAGGAANAMGPQTANVTLGDIAISIPDSANPAESARAVAGGIKDALAAELGNLGLGFGG